MQIRVNGELRRVHAAPDTPLLWVLRDELGLRGTKYGCGIGECGCCTVLVDGAPVPSCALPVGEVAGEVTTIEGLGTPASPHPVQTAWLEENVVQCGYCQPGQMLAAAALIATNPRPDRAAIDAAMAGNLCRCGTYPRIRRAIVRAAEIVRHGDASQTRPAPTAPADLAPDAASRPGEGQR